MSDIRPLGVLERSVKWGGVWGETFVSLSLLTESQYLTSSVFVPSPLVSEKRELLIASYASYTLLFNSVASASIFNLNWCSLLPSSDVSQVVHR